MTKELTVKTVNCSGINMIACQTNDEILVGIKSVCDGLGIAYNGQMERIKRDELIIQGVRNLRIPSEGGEQRTNMLIISFLPFFLTGIKSKMVKPEIKDKILEFKLKAKDVLAQAFLPQQTITPIISTSQPTQIQSPSDIALYYLTEAMKSLTLAQSETERKVNFLQEFANEQCMSFCYEMEDVKDSIQKVSDTINSNCFDLEEEIKEIQINTDCHTEDIEELKQNIQYLLDWRIETIQELIDNHNDIYSLKNTVINLDSKSSIVNEAQRITLLLSDQEYRKWAHRRIIEIAREKHMYTGKVRNATYKFLTEKCGYNYLANRCNITEIVYGNYKNIQLCYTMILLGASDNDFKELNLLSA